jgi:hypothetical protein
MSDAKTFADDTKGTDLVLVDVLLRLARQMRRVPTKAEALSHFPK